MPAIHAILSTFDADLESFSSILDNQRPAFPLLDEKTGEITTIEKDTPDHILLIGRLTNGALISYTLRGGKVNPDVPSTWTIYGEKGEIAMTGQMMAMISIGTEKMTLSVHDFGKETAEKISVDYGEYAGLHLAGRNVARVYDAYADGQWVPDWEHATKIHALVTEVFGREEDGSQYVPAKYTQ